MRQRSEEQTNYTPTDTKTKDGTRRKIKKSIYRKQRSFTEEINEGKEKK